MGGMPLPLPEDTMFVFVSSRNTAVDYYVHDKLCVWSWFRAARDAARVASPPIEHVPTYETPDLPGFDDDPRYPNIVVKYADWDQGECVRFARVRDGAEARRAFRIDRDSGAPKVLRLGWEKRIVNRLTPRGRVVYQPFVPMTIDEDGRMIYYRLHVLVTPVTSRFLSAHAIVGPAPVPAEIPYGLVRDDRAFILSFSMGSTYRRVEPAVEEELRAVGTAIGSIAAEALARRFVTSPAAAQPPPLEAPAGP
jgi:hypothetical protein